MFKRQRWLLKVFWINWLWHWKNPYGYCSGWNWQTCKELDAKECPCIKYNEHCSCTININGKGYYNNQLISLKQLVKKLKGKLYKRRKKCRGLKG